MKIAKLSVIAALAMGAWLAVNNATAQDNADKGGKGGKKGGFTVEQRMERLDRELKLTDEQKPKVKAILEDQAKEMQGLSREERMQKYPEMHKQMGEKLKPILTADQYKKWEE